MNSLQVFNSQQFGRVRVVVSDGKPLFMANDVAKALGYANPRDAIYKHCKGVAKRDTLTGKRKTVSILHSRIGRLPSCHALEAPAGRTVPRLGL